MRIIRVFPRRTRATPDDDLVRINEPPGLFDEADEVHISVAFTWDRERAEELEPQWRHVAPVNIGGPGVGTRGDGFEPGMYLKHGYTITSRGCPNRCWFCDVWKREGSIRELPIREGWVVQDDNLLACSEDHIRAVFAMLKRQRHPVELRGLESALLTPWHVELLADLRPKQTFFAYDSPGDLEPLIQAGIMLRSAGIRNSDHSMRCYVLIGVPGDTMDASDLRMRQAYDAGFLPMAMLYRDGQGNNDYEWRRFQRSWARPASIVAMCKTGTVAWK